jgi:NLI interacting factor-like phosphatase
VPSVSCEAVQNEPLAEESISNAVPAAEVLALDGKEQWRKEHWLFDLDGCLVDSFDGTSLRPLARELLEALRARGHGVDIWSAGGHEYAERVATRVGIRDLIGNFWTKDRGVTGKWTLPLALNDFRVVCVDDQPDGVPTEVEKISVFPYLGPNPHDQVLRKLLDRVQSVA